MLPPGAQRRREGGDGGEGCRRPSLPPVRSGGLAGAAARLRYPAAPNQ